MQTLGIEDVYNGVIAGLKQETRKRNQVNPYCISGSTIFITKTSTLTFILQTKKIASENMFLVLTLFLFVLFFLDLNMFIGQKTYLSESLSN